MPHIVVYGMPPMLHRQDELAKLIDAIRTGVAGVPALELTERQVTVSIPADQCLLGLGEELVVHVVGLFRMRKRTKKVVGEMNACILDACLDFAQVHLPTCAMIEVFLPDRPTAGFTSWHRDAPA